MIDTNSIYPKQYRQSVTNRASYAVEEGVQIWLNKEDGVVDFDSPFKSWSTPFVRQGCIFILAWERLAEELALNVIIGRAWKQSEQPYGFRSSVQRFMFEKELFRSSRRVFWC